jgi:hypothetical protein
MEEDFPQSSICSCGIRFCSAGNKTRGAKFDGFLVRNISSVATLTMTTGKCGKPLSNTRDALRIANTAGAKT